MRSREAGRAVAADDSWDAVWDAYEARRAATPPPAPEAAAPGSAGGWRIRIGVALAALALGFLAAMGWPLASLSAQVARQDTPAVLRALDAAPARGALALALHAHAGIAGPADGAAERMLAAMAETIADGMTAPGGLLRLVQVRGGAVDPRSGHVRDPAAPSLPRLQPAARFGVTLALMPDQGEGGLRLHMASDGAGGWQARAIALLDPGVRPEPWPLAGPGAGPPRR